MENRDYFVEKILEKRVRFGKVEYLLKWQGFPDTDNSWEPLENLDCQELIDDFEAKLQNNHNSPKRKLDNENANKKRKSTSDKDVQGSLQQLPPRGFERGLEAEKILGATDSKGELMFLMKWKNSDEADLVPSRIANLKCPQVVIKFYEERLMWNTVTPSALDDEQPANNKTTSIVTPTASVAPAPAPTSVVSAAVIEAPPTTPAVTVSTASNQPQLTTASSITTVAAPTTTTTTIGSAIEQTQNA